MFFSNADWKDLVNRLYLKLSIENFPEDTLENAKFCLQWLRMLGVDKTCLLLEKMFFAPFRNSLARWLNKGASVSYSKQKLTNLKQWYGKWREEIFVDEVLRKHPDLQAQF